MFTTPQVTIRPCLECGGQRVGVVVSEETGIGRSTGKGKYAHAYVSGLRAVVCTVCGQVTYYAKDMELLQKNLREHPEGFTY
jgi:hypothetical protein